MGKPITVVHWIAINALLGSCQSARRPGAEIVIGVDDAVAVLALERADQDDGIDANEPPALAVPDDCDVAELRRRVSAHYDADRDGMLDADELRALQRDFGGRTPRGKPRQTARLEQIKLLRWLYDANADRKLDADEWRTLRQDLDARCVNDRSVAERRAPSAAQHARLDARESTAARDARRREIAAHWRLLVDRFDTDGDRLLNMRERAALREYERSVVRGERVAALPVNPANTDAGGDAAHER